MFFLVNGPRHKAVISLKLASRLTPDQPQQGVLTIARPKLFGKKVEIPLQPSTSSLVSVSRKEAHRYQLKIRYGSRLQAVTLRAPTSAIYETWWAALENALAPSNFVVLPVIDARTHQVPIAPAQAARRKAPRPKHTATLEPVEELESEDESSDDIPMLESGGPSSPTESDILASWRTWATLDYFATPPSVTDPLSNSESPEAAAGNTSDSAEDCSSDRVSVYSDISEFWSRPSEWEDEIPLDDPVPFTKVTDRQATSPISHHRTAPQPQDDDDKWLDEIALFAFRQKVGAARKSERRPTRQITGRLQPPRAYALF
ncbi:hypothetical protein PHYPSEUDO_003877 [Phytophthora pseudosyringae]|uniref:Uncharacterized protein n=1 Tax=Phytophthora pseudosyringae TaxID=221518 RepID=A0A8T1VUR7_9STRA|nr:hypothetical protein PHYPSEUDO_003877 [Phytophthora pseudosyringae]